MSRLLLLKDIWRDENGNAQPPLVVGAPEEVAVTLTDENGWDAAAADGTWTWYLTMTTQGDPSTELLSAEYDSATITTNKNEDDTLTLTWNLTASETEGLQAGRLLMGIHAEDADGVVEAHTETRGLVPVVNWPGGLP